MCAKDKPLILAADDDADVCALLRASLGQAGYPVMTTRELQDVLPLARMHRPALIMLDVYMSRGGEEDSIQLVGSLHDDPYTKHIPILLISARSDLVTILGHSGAQGAMAKPFSPQDLVNWADMLAHDHVAPAKERGAAHGSLRDQDTCGE